jgi:hypothetical protein
MPVHDKDYRENFARSLFLTGKSNEAISFRFDSCTVHFIPKHSDTYVTELLSNAPVSVTVTAIYGVDTDTVIYPSDRIAFFELIARFVTMRMPLHRLNPSIQSM